MTSKDKAIIEMKSNLINKILLIIFVAATASFGQFKFSLSASQSYESNPFRYTEERESWVSEYNLGMQYDFNILMLSYNGSYNRFESFTDRNFYWQQIALFKRFETSETGVYYEQRLNNELYNVYDYSAFNFYFNQRFLSDVINIFWNSDVALNSYNQLEDLNHYLLRTALKFQKSFQSRTTIIAGAGFKYKNYINNQIIEQTSNVVRLSVLGNGSGHGNGPGMRGRDFSGYGYSDSMAVHFSEVPATAVSQLNGWVRLAQSLFKATGLALQYSQSILLNGNNRDISGLTYNYADESQFFDDPLGYEQRTIGGELTQLLPWMLQMKAGYYFTTKDYAVQTIYIDAENTSDSVLRSDDRHIFWLSLNRRFNIHMFANELLVVSLDFSKLNNSSNSYWYNYDNLYSNLTFSLEF